MGLGPASAGSFHGEFPDVVLSPTSRRVDLVVARPSLSDRPETFSTALSLPQAQALLGIASQDHVRLLPLHLCACAGTAILAGGHQPLAATYVGAAHQMLTGPIGLYPGGVINEMVPPKPLPASLVRLKPAVIVLVLTSNAAGPVSLTMQAEL